jgi:hypothetical protein
MKSGAVFFSLKWEKPAADSGLSEAATEEIGERKVIRPEIINKINVFFIFISLMRVSAQGVSFLPQFPNNAAMYLINKDQVFMRNLG